MTQPYYSADGTRLPSVTTILATLNQPFLLAWYGKLGTEEANRQRDAAANIGTRVHAACQAIAEAKETLLRYPLEALTPDDVLPHVEAFRGWFEDHVTDVLACETPMVSELHRIGGTLDLAAVVDGANTLLDIKTSKAWDGKPHFEWGLQCSAYSALLYETRGLLCARRLVVQLPSNRPGEIQVHELPADEMARDFQAFLSLLRIYRLKQAHDRKPPMIATTKGAALHHA